MNKYLQFVIVYNYSLKLLIVYNNNDDVYDETNNDDNFLSYEQILIVC